MKKILCIALLALLGLSSLAAGDAEAARRRVRRPVLRAAARAVLAPARVAVRVVRAVRR